VTGGEAKRFAALVEATVHPAGAMPAVAQTDAVAAFDAFLRAAPPINRLALRAMVRWGLAKDLIGRVAAHCYYGDPRVMLALGYDADAVVARAAGVRAAEGRP
jgi:hypothetical protein